MLNAHPAGVKVKICVEPQIRCQGNVWRRVTLLHQIIHAHTHFNAYLGGETIG